MLGKRYGPGKYDVGDPVRVGTVNWLIETAEQNSRVFSAGLLDTLVGKLFRRERVPKFGIFELTENMSMPDSSRTGGSSTEPDVPWVDNAEPVYLDVPNYIYKRRTNEPYIPRLYHPYCFRNAYGIGIGYSPACKGDRVPCLLNRQSGRWEIQLPAPDVWRFKLTGALALDGSASANLVNGAKTADTNVTFTVHDALGIFTGSTDDLGYAKYMTDTTAATTILNEGSWEVQMIGKSVTVLTNFQVDAANKKLQKKTQAVFVNGVGTESGWTDIHTGTVCP